MTPNKSPFPPSSRVAAYLRDSGGDTQELSVPQQERAVWEWCENNKLILTRVFKDAGIPGSSVVGREGFQQMLDYFRGEKVPEKGLVIWSFARFSRSFDDAQFFLADLRRRGCQVQSMTDVIPEGTVGKLIEAVHIWKNQDFLETLSREVKRGQHDLVKLHGALGGRVPKGFIKQMIDLGKRRDGSPHIVHRWIPDPSLVDLVRLAFEMKAAGSTVKQIHAATHIYPSVSSYDNFFVNRIYIGEMKFGDMLIENYVEPIVDPGTWKAVQDRIAITRENYFLYNDPLRHPRRINSRWLLSGLAYCGLCDSALVSVSSIHSGKTFDYYKCSDVQHNMGCRAKIIHKKILETAVIDHLKNYIATPEVVEEISAMMRRDRETNIAGIDEQIAQVTQRLGSARLRITNITNAIEQASGSETLVNRLLSLEGEERDLERQAKSLRMRKSSIDLAFNDGFFGRVERLLEKVDTMAPEEVKPLLCGFISKVSIVRVDRTITGKIDFYEVPRFNLLNDEFL